jgi:hypothetical protein
MIINMSEVVFLKDLNPEDVFNAVQFLSNSDIQATFNMRMFEVLQEFYKKRLDVNIILPKTKEENKKGVLAWVKNALSHVPFTPSEKKYENIDLFNDYITTDALDYAITEVPIENQFLKELGSCDEEESLANKILLCMKDTEKNFSLLGSTLDQKYKLLEELERKLLMQKAVIESELGKDDENIFFL